MMGSGCVNGRGLGRCPRPRRACSQRYSKFNPLLVSVTVRMSSKSIVTEVCPLVLLPTGSSKGKEAGFRLLFCCGLFRGEARRQSQRCSKLSSLSSTPSSAPIPRSAAMREERRRWISSTGGRCEEGSQQDCITSYLREGKGDRGEGEGNEERREVGGGRGR